MKKIKVNGRKVHMIKAKMIINKKRERSST